MFRRLRTIFGAEADVAFREQGYLIMATPEGQPLLAENVALQQSMGADIALLGAADLTRGFPWLAIGWRGRRRLWPDRGRLVRPAELRHARCARPPRTTASPSCMISVTAIDARGRVESVRSGRRKAHRLPEPSSTPRAPGPANWPRWPALELPVEPRKRFVYVIDCREATEALRQAPLTVDPSGVWFRPEGRVFLCGKSPEDNEEPPAADLDDIDHAFFEQQVWPQLAARVPAFESVKVINAWAGYYDYNTLDQNAVIGPHPAVANFYFANGFSGHGAQQAAAAGRAIAELIAHGAFQTIDLTRLGYARIVNNAPLPERNVI